MLERIVIITLIVWMIYGIMLPGMILDFFSRWLSRFIPPYLQKPIYACAACMQMWYGSVLYWMIYGDSLREWAIVTSSGIGLSIIIISFLPKD